MKGKKIIRITFPDIFIIKDNSDKDLKKFLKEKRRRR